MRSLQKPREQARFRLLFLLLILGLCCFAFSGGISGNDFWWHVKAGEYVVQNRCVPTTDIFSWIGMEKGISWTAHEWGAELLLYGLHSALGVTGVFCFSLLAALALLLLLWRQAGPALDRNLPVCALVFSLFAVCSPNFCYGRPHLFSYFLLFAELKLLYAYYENPGDRRIWLVPLLAVLWSNLHGGSSNLSYLLCGLFLAVGACRLRLGRIQCERLPKPALLRLGAVTLLSVAAILVNPVSLRVLIYPYASFADKLSMTVIREWSAPDAKNIGQLIMFFLPVAVLCLCALSWEGSFRVLDAAVLGLFLFLFFRSARFIMLWYIAAPFCLFRYLPPCRIKPVKAKWEKLLLGLMTAAVPLALLAAGTAEMVRTMNRGELVSVVMKDEAVEFVKQQAPKRLFNDYNLGEALIYHEIPVFFDARADLFAQEHIMEDGVSLLLLEQANPERDTPYVDVSALVEEYGFDALLVRRDRPLYAYLTGRPEEYILAYEDDSLGYFTVQTP